MYGRILERVEWVVVIDKVVRIDRYFDERLGIVREQVVHGTISLDKKVHIIILFLD